MSSFEDRVNTLLGLIVLADPTSLDFFPVKFVHDSPPTNTIIELLELGDIEGAYKSYTLNGSLVQTIVCNHLLFITNNGYTKYKKLVRLFA